MRSRCYNKNYREYHRYGGRGISVCPEWRYDFQRFLSDVGRKPSRAHSLDRIDNDGNYEPGNCRWATRVEQAEDNRGSKHGNAKLTEEDVRQIRQMHQAGHTLADLGRRYGVRKDNIWHIVHRKTWRHVH